MIIQNMFGPSQPALPEPRVAGDSAPRSPVSEPAASPQSAATPEPTAAKLRQAVDELNRAVQPTNNNLQFSIDQSTQLVVVKVVDAETGDVIRQIPPKTALAIAEQIDQQLNGKKGLLLSQSA